MKAMLVTNNSQIRQKYNNKYEIYFIEGTYLDVLVAVRNRIHEGHKLLTHPLSGSIKPNETPYKSVMISGNKGEVHLESLQIIEEGIHTAQKFIASKALPKWTENILQDFKEIDVTLIDSAIESIEQF